MQDGRVVPRVKNLAPAAVQVTTEQLLREAQERQDAGFCAPKQRVEDFEELREYRNRKRKEYEEHIGLSRSDLKEWQAYASWEASQGEFERSRSVYERALEVDPHCVSLWLSYTEMELNGRNVQHARNLFDRAVTLLPRVEQLWYKYVYLEELLENVAGARQVFERWMKWEPEDKAWQAYTKMEERYGEHDRASRIFERWIAVRPEPRIWVKWAKFEEGRSKIDAAREVFKTALEFFGDDIEQIEKAQAVFIAFAKMETRQKEYESAREIYKFALDRVPRDKSSSLYFSYTNFEKQHGTRSTLECTVLAQRRVQYEDDLAHDGQNYDAWLDYVRHEDATMSLKEAGADDAEMGGAIGRVRDVYERAVSHVPPSDAKRHWRRYIYLWLYYALFEEICAKDYERARQVYRTALTVVPHKNFTFAKLWLAFAYFEVRQMDLLAARKVLGGAIGMCPKEKLFKGYIKLEEQLREFDRERSLYEKYIQYDPANSSAWIEYAQLEASLGDHSRTRAIYELALGQPHLSKPENLWKAYIDSEIEQGERVRARTLYERLTGLSGDVKVWSSFAKFESASIPLPANQSSKEGNGEEDKEGMETVKGDMNAARQVFHRGLKYMKEKGLQTERYALLKAGERFEQEHGTTNDLAKVAAMMPIVSRVDVVRDEATQVSDMLFLDDVQKKNPASHEFLQMARMWNESQPNEHVSHENTTPGLREPSENAS
ncbi:protein prenylyltransferase [Rickenella mellea]|uniref:Pre-mRNA-splicing factor CLF1 n=1 Tax=Rickenella mellea TaxID=50990 RepID=A0A4Y7Q7A2_9AGAM|nr:protein prenylyltransferase [Rickenella mellea]